MKYGHSAKFLHNRWLKRLNQVSETLWTEADKRFAILLGRNQDMEEVIMFGDRMAEPTTFQGLAGRYV
jgi:hypothetical protein